MAIFVSTDVRQQQQQNTNDDCNNRQQNVLIVKKGNNSLINYRSIAVTICKYTYRNKHACQVLRNSYLKFRGSSMYNFCNRQHKNNYSPPGGG